MTTTDIPPVPPSYYEITGSHDCPVCRVEVPQKFRPGRARIYCTNACRQKAYRWRRSHGVRLCVERDGAAERSVNDRRHALRDRRDPVSGIHDDRGREVTVCGTFASPVRDRQVTHDRFLADHPWSCETCIALIGVGPPGSDIPDAIAHLYVEGRAA
jgi:hypothetical protein